MSATVVTFTRVTYQNFLASGASPISINLNAHRSTLIVGKNGAGKSTMTEAICFALFGKPLRNINKPMLVNSVNGKDCLVTLEFLVGTRAYKVVRGIKPAVFDIYEGDSATPLPKPAAIADYQRMLEENIVHLNYKAFMQVVVLGSASYTPFMRLTTGARREIIEDLLDIEIFGIMNSLSKDEASDVKHKIDQATSTRNHLSQQRKMAEAFKVHLEEQHADVIGKIEADIVAETAKLADLNTKLDSETERLEDYEGYRTARNAAQTKIREYETMLATVREKERVMAKERDFYTKNDSCPTCEQLITETFKATRLDALAKKAGDATKATAQCQGIIAKWQEKVTEAATKLKEADAIQQAVAKLEATRDYCSRQVSDLKRKLSLEKQPKPKQEQIDVVEIDSKLTGVDVALRELSHAKIIIDAAGMLLKDNGIKARVIRHYLPIINQTINSYLNAMDFPILFTLDEEFKETMKSRHRDEFAYDSFSEGEKKRIDLALLLTWRAVAALKNSASTNILILDEVFDSSLDADGTEEFLKIIASLEERTNVFVISHKKDQLVDKFSHTIAFAKHRGFSQIQA